MLCKYKKIIGGMTTFFLVKLIEVNLCYDVENAFSGMEKVKRHTLVRCVEKPGP